MSLERRHFKRLAKPIPVILHILTAKVSCITKDISKEGLCLEIPIQKMPVEIFEILHKNVTIEIKDLMVEGSVKWYTVTDSSYQLGIYISRQRREAWKDIFAQHVNVGGIFNMRNYFQDKTKGNIIE